eukprot:TRINITY_DN2755_c0_g1_i1.p1 TRINITY_DN2755_c0_g1~~TRINITY_DN2755_c0_g1_i1.p1  ORF type:complete len:129 (-),score=52.05 TRINITY_DN2755_c0_g1_i1:57-392(-)
MVLLDNNAFLLAFEKLVEKQKGTVFISMKRFTPSSSSSSSSKKKSKGHSHDDNVQCLIRVTDGKKVKISTTISSKDVVKFQGEYGTIMKSKFSGMKSTRKDKKKKRGAQKM